MTKSEHKIDIQTNQFQPPFSLGMVYLKATVLAFGLVFVVTLVLFMIAFFIAWSKFSAFQSTSGLSINELYQIYTDATKTTPKSTGETTVFLLLGVDSVVNKPNAPQLTDTMMLVSVNHNSGKISMVSIPRDLWSEEFQTKYNALYHYGKERYPDSPETFPKEVISETFGTEIHYTVVVTLDEVAEIVNILGGVTVDVEHSFVDTEFPRSDIPAEEIGDPDKAYKTISFVQGPEKMDGERFLEFIRSRKSADISEGTDDARAQRQKQAIKALESSVSMSTLWDNPEIAGSLYSWYIKTLSKYIPLEDALSLALILLPKADLIEIKTISIPISHIVGEKSDSLISHPDPRLYNGQWVYVITDKEALQSFMDAAL